MLRKFKLNCKDVNHFCDKSQYNEASFWEKAIHKMHMLYCKACRTYSSRNAKLTQLINNSKVETLNPSAKEKIQAVFEKELVKYQ